MAWAAAALETHPRSAISLMIQLRRPIASALLRTG
jgi:hypothetical protein